jgi:glucuronate isomerase
MSFINDNFLLTNDAARRLYHQHAASQPILDYHNHLPPKDIAEDRRFNNLFDIWLEGDHYKWRAMRANGVDERYITGNADPFEKFQAWAATVPHTLRNPLYHWTHLELARYFDIHELLDETSARRIWDQAGEKLQSLTAKAIIKKFDVRALCTTDDPTDDLRYHKQIAEEGCYAKVFPAFRPDKALNVHKPDIWNEWVAKLEASSNRTIGNYREFLDAIAARHDYFHTMGGRLSDHGINHCYADFVSDTVAGKIFAKARSGKPATEKEQVQFASNLMLYFGQLDAGKKWTKQLHLGALRNNNSRMVALLGPDTGYDSMGTWNQAEALSKYLDRLDKENALPQMILYNVNPVDNYTLATMIGNFQGGGIPGKMQFGSGWWFLDQKEGIEWQVNALSNVGLLSRFVGMLTDSRSFMSYPRHEYFRRVVCNMLGKDIESGEIPDNGLADRMVADICFANAQRYFNLPGLEAAASKAA